MIAAETGCPVWDAPPDVLEAMRAYLLERSRRAAEEQQRERMRARVRGR